MPEQPTYGLLFMADGHMQRLFFDSRESAERWADRLDEQRQGFTLYKMTEIRREANPI